VTRIVDTFGISDLSRRALLRGGASAFDLRGNTAGQYRLHATGEAADAAAIRNDWATVGADLKAAAESVTDTAR